MSKHAKTNDWGWIAIVNSRPVVMMTVLILNYGVTWNKLLFLAAGIWRLGYLTVKRRSRVRTVTQ